MLPLRRLLILPLSRLIVLHYQLVDLDEGVIRGRLSQSDSGRE